VRRLERWYTPIGKISKRVWATFVALTALLSLLAFFVLNLNIGVERGPNDDPQNPFTHQFEVVNNSNYSIRIHTSCYVDQVWERDPDGSTTGFSYITFDSDPSDFAELAQGGRKDVLCSGIQGQNARGTPGDFTILSLKLQVNYIKPRWLFSMKGCRAIGLNGSKAKDGTYNWSFTSAEACK
jgi:hypothetical protein